MGALARVTWALLIAIASIVLLSHIRNDDAVSSSPNVPAAPPVTPSASATADAQEPSCAVMKIQAETLQLSAEPHHVISVLEPYVLRCDVPAQARLFIHQRLGEILVHLKEYDRGVMHLRKALVAVRTVHEKSSRLAELIQVHASLAHALQHTFEFDEAHHLLEAALSLAQQIDTKRSGGVVASLLRLQSSVSECEGDFTSALLTFERSQQLLPGKEGGLWCM